MDKDWLKVGHSHENFVWSLLSLRHSPHTPRLTLCRSGEKKENPPYNSAGCQFKPPLIVRLVVCPSVWPVRRWSRQKYSQWRGKKWMKCSCGSMSWHVPVPVYSVHVHQLYKQFPAALCRNASKTFPRQNDGLASHSSCYISLRFYSLAQDSRLCRIIWYLLNNLFRDQYGMSTVNGECIYCRCDCDCTDVWLWAMTVGGWCDSLQELLEEEAGNVAGGLSPPPGHNWWELTDKISHRRTSAHQVGEEGRHSVTPLTVHSTQWWT